MFFCNKLEIIRINGKYTCGSFTKSGTIIYKYFNKNENKVAAKTIIEINGRSYDALTGRIIRDVDAQLRTKAPQTPKSGVIDGFQKPKQKLHSSVSTKPVPPKKLQRSQTLARNVVKKPVPGARQLPAVTPLKARGLSVAETRRRILAKTPPQRVERAATTKQSPNVTRFASTNNVPRPVVTAPIAVAREKVVAATPAPSAPPISAHTSVSASHPTKKQEFTHPLASANAHLAIPPKKRRFYQKIADRLTVSPRVAGAITACLAIVVLAGFFAYQRIPNLSMRVAASRAGFAGTVPATTPAGYAFKGPIKYEKDTIIVSYKSNSDNREFKIVQRPSTWNSEALLTNYVDTTNLRYQTYNNKGLTVYIMGTNSAAWVDNGIWYSLTGTNTLSTEQILAMAASM